MIRQVVGVLCAVTMPEGQPLQASEATAGPTV
jgi:hypothetical protein